MAFNKVSMVLFLLVLAAVADARISHSGVSSKVNHPGDDEVYCTSCECEGEKCIRRYVKIGGCPLICEEKDCLCTRDYVPTCWCSYEEETCNPKVCNAVGIADNKLAKIFMPA